MTNLIANLTTGPFSTPLGVYTSLLSTQNISREKYATKIIFYKRCQAVELSVPESMSSFTSAAALGASLFSSSRTSIMRWIKRPQSEGVVDDVENEVGEVVADDGDEDKPVAGLLDIGVEQYEQTLR